MCVYFFVCVDICIYIHINKYTYTCVYKYIYIYVYTHIYMCVYTCNISSVEYSCPFYSFLSVFGCHSLAQPSLHFLFFSPYSSVLIPRAIKRPRTRPATVCHWHDLSLSAYERVDQRDLVTNEKV